MEPLSRKKRTFYFILLTLVFFIVSPLLIFYAKGYRPNFGEVFKVALTGGLYISADEAGASIYVNDTLVRKTNIVQKSIFVQDLKPGLYSIKVTKDEQQSWEKSLKVFPELVTEAHPFLLDNDTSIEEIPMNLIAGTPTTSPSNIRNPEYVSINSLFTNLPIKATTTKATSTALINQKAIRRVTVNNEGGKLHVSWEGEIDLIPDYFCEERQCVNKSNVNTPSAVKSFDFFPGRDDLLIVRLQDGIYVTEIDGRSKQNIQKLIEGSQYDFRVRDGSEIYLKNGLKIYSVSL